MGVGRALALGLTVWLAAAGAAAQPAPASEDARIAEALELRVQQRDAEALTLLTSVWEQTRSPRARAQMARAEQALGRWLDAHQHMSEALASEDDPWISARRASLEEERERIRAHLGRLEVLGGVPGATVRIEGREVGSLPLREALWVNTGTVQIELVAPGYLTAQRSVAITAGRTARETVAMVPVRAAPAAAPVVVPVAIPPAMVATGGPSRGAPWATLGNAAVITGAVLLVGGVASHVVRERSVASAAELGCGYDPSGRLAGPAECAGRVETIDLATALLVTGYTAGALLVGGGVAALVAAPRGAPRPRARLRCAPTWGGASCVVAF